jgi:hypothetical protein
MVINPLYQIVGYFDTEYRELTTEQLDHITVSLYHAGLTIKQRDQAFFVVEYLADNGVLDLIKNPNETFSVKLKEH